MKAHSPFISKSKYLSGLQCLKLLWYQYNAKDQIPAIDAQTQAIFDQGHQVGDLAKTLYPGGIEITGAANDFGKLLELSKVALGKRKPLFEAAFKSGNAYARADILNPVGTSDWEIIEVKSSTEVNEINLHDLALQRYVYEGAGFSITKCYLMHINNEYVRRGEVDPKKLFTREDVTSEVQALMKTVRPNLETMAEVIRQKRHPDIAIGLQCNDPYPCQLQDLCWKFLPEHNPLTLYRFKKEHAFELIHDGHLEILNLPTSTKLNDKQTIQRDALRSGKPFVDKDGIRDFLDQLEYPLYYLDFETVGTAIPLFDDVRPYEQISFQYSLHIVESEGKPPRHESYLSDGQSDPRPEILKLLKTLLGKEGSIIAYNAGFEKDKLRKACDVYAEYDEWYRSIEGRFLDLLAPFRSFYYYHPDQTGSASIKKVLPALTGRRYEGLVIAQGEKASLEFLRVTFGDVDEKERRKVREDLETYCALDTEGMILLVEELVRLTR